MKQAVILKTKVIQTTSLIKLLLVQIHLILLQTMEDRVLIQAQVTAHHNKAHHLKTKAPKMIQLRTLQVQTLLQVKILQLVQLLND